MTNATTKKLLTAALAAVVLAVVSLGATDGASARGRGWHGGGHGWHGGSHHGWRGGHRWRGGHHWGGHRRRGCPGVLVGSRRARICFR